MNKFNRLAAKVAGTAALVTLVGASAFADSRHSDETHHERSGGQHSQPSHQQQSHSSSQQQFHPSQQQHFDQRGQQRSDQRGVIQRDARFDGRNDQRFDNRNQRFDNRNDQRFDNRSQQQRFDSRGSQRNESFRNDRSRIVSGRSFDRHTVYNNDPRRSIYGEGRIHNIVHERGGYRVYLDGGRYPYFIPDARWLLNPLRIGLNIRFGGYLDPLGFVSVYDMGDYYGAGYDYAPAYVGVNPSGVMQGVVENIDYRRGTLVLRDQQSGNVITAVMNDQRMDNLRPGDFVTLAGDWSRGGVFQANRLVNFQPAGY